MAIAMIGLVAVTAASVVWLANRTFGRQDLPDALEGLGGQTRLLASTLQAAALGAGADVLAFGRLPEAADAARGEATAAAARQHLVDLFAAILEVKRRYLQIRVLDAEGREVVRVDRSGPEGSVRIVPRDELLDADEGPHVAETLALRRGELYVSSVELNRELGVVETPHVPVVRVATPVASAEGETRGLVILKMDMRAILAALREDAVAGGRQLYVMSGDDYLVHPDPTREFAAARGAGTAWRDELPDVPSDLRSDTTVTTVVELGGESVGLAVRAILLGGGPRVMVALTEPESQLIAAQQRVVRSALLGGTLLTIMATLLATLLAGSLAGPLAGLATAVKRFETVGVWEPPRNVGGEVAVLTDTFSRAIDSQREEQAELERQVEIRRRAEESLAREAAQLRLLSSVAQSSLDGIYTITVDGVVTSWNPGAERLYGHTADEIVGRHVDRLVPDRLRPELDGILKRLAEGTPVRDHETTRLGKDGQERDVSLTLSPVRSDTGAVIGISAIARDIGERKQLEERFRLAVEACPNGMLMVDDSGEIVLVNREIERLFGYAREELLGQSIEILVPHAARNQHPDLRRGFTSRPQRRGMGSGRDLFGRRRDGSELPVEIGLNPIHTPDGLFVLASVVDISERMRAQEDLRRSNEELEQFAYVASHDLQEPLRMVASYTELLSQRYRGQLDERADKYIHYAVDGAKRMQLLINDLLRFSRINSEANPLTPTDLGELVREIVDTRLEAALREAQGTIAIGDLPVLPIDPVQMGQVFQNLISNALKFRAADRPPVVRIGAEKLGRMWRFSVEDNGIGIEPQYAERVFEMFQRLHGGGAYPGSGIGLTLARKIIQRHSGAIWFESTPNRGTTFYFTLPATES